MKSLRFLLAILAFLLTTAFPATAFTNTSATVDRIQLTDLPPEARQTLRLIKQGGPFPYDRDGVVFGNFEKRLPREKRGFYHEYTVKTPGERSRGARRIIAAGDPPQHFYYTADHYRTFRLIQE